MEFGVVTLAEGAFAAVFAALSIIIAQIERLSSFTAGIAFVSVREFHDTLLLLKTDGDSEIAQLPKAARPEVAPREV